MNPTKRKDPPEPSTTRTDSDVVMVILGILLAVVFLMSGYLSLRETGQASPARLRGPVKDPGASSMLRQPTPAAHSMGPCTGKIVAGYS
jgi:hypothetical protein